MTGDNVPLKGEKNFKPHPENRILLPLSSFCFQNLWPMPPFFIVWKLSHPLPTWELKKSMGAKWKSLANNIFCTKGFVTVTIILFLHFTPDELYPAALEQQLSLCEDTHWFGVCCGSDCVFLLPSHHFLRVFENARWLWQQEIWYVT